jgi:hypothetical protein
MNVIFFKFEKSLLRKKFLNPGPRARNSLYEEGGKREDKLIGIGSGVRINIEHFSFKGKFL